MSNMPIVPDPTISNDPSQSPSAALDDLIDLPRGEGYRISEADQVTRRAITNVILFAGTAESGKTTLLSSMYLMFHKGPFEKYLFAGSTTLVGFEKRVHNCRLASGLDKPNTERSKFSELLHLRVRREDGTAETKELLLCDLWGEDFREARDSAEGCKRLVIIRRADVFVLLVDGGKLARLESRQQAKSDPVMLLRNIIDCKMLSETARVDVLFTKWDIVIASSERDEIEVFAKHVESEIRRHFEARLGRLRFFRVAAHPKEGKLPMGYGLGKVFPSWIEDTTGLSRHSLVATPEPPNACEYDRFLRRNGLLTI